ncbi:adenylate/guanylate cyclase domain-containing protein [Tychonema sp. BBK16]|uniref:adenylate/guanylate cyclase domain-containing protein n=1 Tax=Tychonema sp. BBK16 TaxID=2699888 RepID=UPI001F3D99EA|nr:adenylate/guanylate cyclase domain-containing protein [Tychonema sp. BBK16]MCF6372174.1 adenylate cyclase [Tychonema sp. BBK16]
MANLRSTVIVKTDICGYTVRVKKLSQSELSSLLNEHKTFISDISIRNEGSLIKGEGDSFWLIFPSVTAAAMAALEMQQELRAQQSSKSNDERLAIRVSITLGDVLHQDKDIFGDTVNLTARIESVTPQDEIYLSQAAWLALNKAEVQTSFVNEFSLKGMSEPEKVYKVDQSHKTRIIENQAIVKADLRGFIAYQESNSIKDVEYLLTNFDAFEKIVCEEYGGTIRSIVGDSHLLTFAEAHSALAAMESLCKNWKIFIDNHKIPCGLSVGVTKGNLYIFRSCTYGKDINIADRLEDLSKIVSPATEKNSVIVSDQIKREVSSSKWEYQLIKIDKNAILDNILDYSQFDFFKENDVYRCLVI